MNHQRPVNMDLASLKFPSTAVASILHRLSGISIFLLLPFILYILSLSLNSRASYEDLEVLLASYPAKFGLWVFSSALAYHVIAGVRHMILDMGFGESIVSAKRSALAVIIISLVIIILLGVCICCPM
ncbi:MAG: succinate dehydrogenase, cytochrome b556 subunit [Legionellaceae bacterium]|nr:succinate dehydrogenase, cytochrome b556 subunit [Legionellaceae bacterium]